MFELISLSVLIISVLMIGLIIYRKLPFLLEPPEVLASHSDRRNFLSGVRGPKIFKGFCFEILLQKILSKARILILKTDNKTFSWLQKLKEKSQKKKFDANDNYWEKVRKSTKL